MGNKMKKLICALLASAMLVTSVGVVAFADGEDTADNAADPAVTATASPEAEATEAPEAEETAAPEAEETAAPEATHRSGNLFCQPGISFPLIYVLMLDFAPCYYIIYKI